MTKTSKPVETLTEWAVRFGDGMIWERPTQDAAMVSVRGITSRGGQATVVSRQVTRTAWADHPNEEQQRPRSTTWPPPSAALRVTDHTFEGTPGQGKQCETDMFGQTCGATWEQHELRDDSQHQDPNRLGHRPADLALMCACGAEVFPGLRTTTDNRPTSAIAVDNPEEQA